MEVVLIQEKAPTLKLTVTNFREEPGSEKMNFKQ